MAGAPAAVVGTVEGRLVWMHAEDGRRLRLLAARGAARHGHEVGAEAAPVEGARSVDAGAGITAAEVGLTWAELGGRGRPGVLALAAGRTADPVEDAAARGCAARSGQVRAGRFVGGFRGILGGGVRGRFVRGHFSASRGHAFGVLRAGRGRDLRMIIAARRALVLRVTCRWRAAPAAGAETDREPRGDGNARTAGTDEAASSHARTIAQVVAAGAIRRATRASRPRSARRLHPK